MRGEITLAGSFSRGRCVLSIPETIVERKPFTLTKSEYAAGLQCPKRLFFEKHRADIPRDPSGPVDRWRRHEGQLAGELARERYPQGELVEQAPWEPDEAVARTATLMAEDTTHIFEAALGDGQFTARVDVLSRSGRSWNLTEVKTGMAPKDGEDDPKDKYVADAAFQLMVAQNAGVPINRVNLLLLSRSYSHRGGRHDAGALFEEVDITIRADKEVANTRAKAEELLRLLDGPEPEIETNRHCKKPYKCPYFSFCHAEQPEHDLVFLPLIRAEKITDLRAKGYRTIDEIPATEKLNPSQERVRSAVVSGRPWIGEGLRAALDNVKYPIHFIDFEAAASALPKYTGLRCHQPVPFQWSNHILHESGRQEHLEYLHRGPSDPSQAFIDTLWEAVQGAGSIVYYTDYENQRLKSLRMDGIASSERLEAYVRERGVDLFKIVKENVYHPAFKGSYSIKTVLPALVEGLGYDDLYINEGQLAAVEFMRMVECEDAEEANGIAAQLLAYCERDTLAMVKVFEALREMAGVRAREAQGVFELI